MPAHCALRQTMNRVAAEYEGNTIRPTLEQPLTGPSRIYPRYEIDALCNRVAGCSPLVSRCAKHGRSLSPGLVSTSRPGGQQFSDDSRPDCRPICKTSASSIDLHRSERSWVATLFASAGWEHLKSQRSNPATRVPPEHRFVALWPYRSSDRSINSPVTTD